MRLPVTLTGAVAALVLSACASQPPAKPANMASAAPLAEAAAADGAPQAAAANPAPTKKAIPERVKGPYKVVMRGDKKLYCTKELATGSHVNHRTICLTAEEYAEIERQSREWKLRVESGAAIGGGPAGTGPGQNPMSPGGVQ